jgi:hypothetical protein
MDAKNEGVHDIPTLLTLLQLVFARYTAKAAYIALFYALPDTIPIVGLLVEMQWMGDIVPGDVVPDKPTVHCKLFVHLFGALAHLATSRLHRCLSITAKLFQPRIVAELCHAILLATSHSSPCNSAHFHKLICQLQPFRKKE